jgi:hypothetical protein
MSDSHVLNPTAQQVRRLPLNTEVTIEGHLISVRESVEQEPTYSGSPTMRDETYYHAQIDPGNGDRPIEVRFNRQPTLKDGVLENLYGSIVDLGEKISFTAGVTYNKKQDVVQLHGGYGEDIRLLAPSGGRQTVYDSLREMQSTRITTLAQAIEEQSWQQARKCFAIVVSSAYTKAELKQLRQLIRQMPLEEQPVFDSYRYGRNTYADAYGFIVEELNAKEFLDIVAKMLRQELPLLDGVDQHPSTSYVFGYLEGPQFTSAARTALYIKVLEERFAVLEGADLSDSDKDVIDFYGTTDLIRQLGRESDPDAFLYLADLIDLCFDRNYFDSRLTVESDRLMHFHLARFLDTTVESIVQFVDDPDWRHPAGFEPKRIIVWRNRLAAFPFMDKEAQLLQRALPQLMANR